MIPYARDGLGQIEEERWYASPTGFDPSSTRNVALGSLGIPQSTLSRTVDALGRNTAASGPRYDNGYNFDTAGRLTSVEREVLGREYQWQSRHAANHSMTGRDLLSDGDVVFVDGLKRDDADRLSELTRNFADPGVADLLVTMDYDAAGRHIETTRRAGSFTGPSTALSHDGAGRIGSIDHGPSSSTTSSYTTTFDVAGLIAATSAVSTFAGATSTLDYVYTHDRRGQLTDRSDGLDYDYDASGNRTGTNPNDDNRIVNGDHGTTFRYDAEGNRVWAGGDTFVFDHRNRLTDATTDGALVEYVYDESNHLIAREESGGRERYVRDGDQTGMTDRDGPADTAHLWGESIDQLLAETDLGSDETFWTLTDHLGSVRDRVTESGTVVHHVDYDPFGNTEIERGSDPIAGELDYAYTARPTDTQTRLQNNRNRWYDADEGRWISQDPIGFEAGDANLYRYVNNSALTMIDPLGLERQPTLTSEEAEKLHKDLKEYAKLANLGAGFYGKGLGASNFLNYLNGRGTCVYAGPDKLSEQQIKRLVELAMRSIFNGPIPGQTTSDSNGVHIHPYKFVDGGLSVAVGGTHDVYAIPKNCQMQSGGFAPRGSIDLHFDIFDIYDFHRNDLNIELWGSSRFTGRQTDYFKDSEMLDLECHGFAKRFEFHLKFKIPVKFVLDANNRLVSITTGKAESWVR